MKTGRTLLALAVVIAACIGGRVSLAQTEEGDRAAEAARVLKEIQEAKDTTIPKQILEKARAIAVFPSTVKVTELSSTGCVPSAITRFKLVLATSIW